MRNLADLGIRDSDLEVSAVDLRCFPRALEATQGAETVFHLAARIGSIDYMHGSNAKELESFQMNAAIDANVFRACRENGVKNLIYASSVGVYKPSLSPLAEHHVNQYPSNPDGGYGWSKRVGEIQLDWLDHINIGIARICNVYGINSDLVKSPPVISSFMLSALHGRDIVLWGDGEQARDFIHVHDCVAGLLQIEKHLSETKIVVNIGSGKAHSIQAVAEKIANICGGGSKITYEPARLGKPISLLIGPPYQVADMSRAKHLLNWEPLISLDEGLERTYSWMKGVHHGNIR